MSTNTPPQADPQAIANAQAMWTSFTKAGTIMIIAISALLGLMAITLV